MRDDADLLEKGQVVLEMPVVSDATAAHGNDIRRDEIDRLPGASPAVDLSGEMAGEAEIRDDAITSENLLGHDDLQVRHGSEKSPRGGRRPRRPLRSTGR